MLGLLARVVIGVVAAGVVVADDRNFAVGTYHVDELAEIGLELVVDSRLVGNAVNTFVA